MRTASFGPGWRSWWKGDEVHATFVKSVAQTLRELAYKTRIEARKRIVRRGWGTEWEDSRRKTGRYRGRFVEIKKYKTVWRLITTPAGLTRKVKRRQAVLSGGWLKSRSKARYYRPSRPGESPTNQRGVLRGSILYDFHERNGVAESIVGAIAMGGSGPLGHWSMTNGQATKALEWGGWTRNHGGKQVYIAARPFMRPAASDVLRAGVLRKSLDGMLTRGWKAQGSTSGWSSKW